MIANNRSDRNVIGSASIVCLILCSVVSCATGVDVSDEELAELYAQSMTGGRVPVGGNGGASVIGGNGGTSAIGGNGGASLGGIGGTSGGTGGTSASTGGSAGTTVPINPGVACGASPPIASGGCASETSPTVVYTDRSDSPIFNQLTMALTVENVGPINLQDLVLRYWFSADQGQTDFVAEIDYAEVGKENVCVSFGNQLGQSFADIAFSGGAPTSEGLVRDVQVRLHTPNYAQQDQGNDFSFMASADQVANENITVYVAGSRVSGCEP